MAHELRKAALYLLIPGRDAGALKEARGIFYAVR
jgi:hypothetical protein